MAQIILLNGQSCLVDDDDFDFLKCFSWYSTKGYAARSVTTEEKRQGLRGGIKMHRQIMNAKRGQIVDHINMDTLDNRKCNLRFCTNSQNHANGRCRPTVGRTSKYRGVAWSNEKQCWRAYVVCKFKQTHIGYFHNEVDAAKAYDFELRRLFWGVCTS